MNGGHPCGTVGRRSYPTSVDTQRCGEDVTERSEPAHIHSSLTYTRPRPGSARSPSRASNSRRARTQSQACGAFADVYLHSGLVRRRPDPGLDHPGAERTRRDSPRRCRERGRERLRLRALSASNERANDQTESSLREALARSVRSRTSWTNRRSPEKRRKSRSPCGARAFVRGGGRI